jgi:dephospho-CoA kinase
VLVVGLTGGIASGKTVVAKMLGSLGATLIDADAISRELVEPGSPSWKAIVDRFGAAILERDSRISRKRLGEIVFRDSHARAWINELLHPRILGHIRRRVAEIEEKNPRCLVIVEAALLVEAGAHRDFDRLVVTLVSERTQLARLMNRDGITEEEAGLRLEAQLPIKEKAKVADYVIDNDGSLDDTRRQVEGLYRALVALNVDKKGLDKRS